MTTIIHCADLHLTRGEDREYSLSVLDEILTITDHEKAEYLLICGDLFDSFEDADIMRAEFRSRIEPIRAHCQILFIPGNHEDLGKGNRKLSNLDLGALRTCYAIPFELITCSDVEFLCIPHQADYRDYYEWDLAPKNAAFRIALAHGLVSGLDIYAGPEPEEEVPVGTIDPDLFARFDIDYAAMGHIHSRRNEMYEQAHISYPGSSRVWRRGETGTRGINLVKIDQTVQVDFHPLTSAGQYRRHKLPLTPNGNIEDIETLSEVWEKYDWIDLNFSGIVEDENSVAELENRLHSEWDGRVRKIEIQRTDVQPLPGIISQPIVKKFLQVWQEKEPDIADKRAYTIWLKARQMGLEQIKNILEARQ
ncbi:MAG: metallophosphoesterase [Candidatus Adiutricales bacterium]